MDLDTILLQAPSGFATLEGPDMVFTRANAAYLTMVGRTAIVGQRWVDVFPELVESPTHHALRSTYRGATLRFTELELPLIIDGEQRSRFFTFTLDPLRDPAGAISGLVVQATEVTELVVRRREAEQLAARLRASEARYRMLFDAMDDGFCLFEMIFDAQGTPVDYRFLEGNEAFLQHTGLVDPIGRTARELVPELDESWFRLYGEVALTGVPKRFENHAPAMGRWFDVFASRVGDPALHQVGLVFKNVSAQKREELHRAELLAAEQAARREAEAANHIKDQFLATVSHELRSPLHAIMGWATMLRSGELPEDRHAHALEVIERNSRIQARLIEDLLDVTRIIEGKLGLAIDAVELWRVVAAAVDTVAPAAEAKQVTISAVPHTGGTVMGDGRRLQQVFWNLLSNAVKFTPTGGQITLSITRDGDFVEVAVRDTGIGIAPTFQPYVFDRFRQADASSTRKHGGLGIGLTIVAQLVELHHGSVRVASEGAGRGATFTVRLPVSARSVDTSDVAPLAHPLELRGLRVLVVDDEADARDMLRGLLESAGATVWTAASASEGFAVFREQRPAVLVSDIGMPVETGYTLIGNIRALPAEQGGDVPAIAVTAFTRAIERTQALLAGFNSHVPKPVEPLELFAVIATLVRGIRGA